MSVPLKGGGSASCSGSSTPDWSKVDNQALLDKYKDGKHQAELDRYAHTAFQSMGSQAYLAANRAGSGGLDESGGKPTAKMTPDISGFIDAQLYTVDKYRKDPSLRTSNERVAGIVQGI